jgi:8-oxo-dGTP pyrophosphatase MutT (NUDIX family)
MSLSRKRSDSRQRMAQVARIDDFDRIRRAIEKPSPASSDFDLNPDISLPDDRRLRPAGVLIPLLETTGGVQVILTKRSSALKHHPGQISFPGGKVEAADSGPVQAALREAGEEIGLQRENAEVLGVLPVHETVTGFCVTPVLAHVKAAFRPIAEPQEVAEVFQVPLAHVGNMARFQVQSRRWQGVERYYYTVPYGPYYIWGATARILYGLAQRLAA